MRFWERTIVAVRDVALESWVLVPAYVLLVKLSQDLEACDEWPRRHDREVRRAGSNGRIGGDNYIVLSLCTKGDATRKRRGIKPRNVTG